MHDVCCFVEAVDVPTTAYVEKGEFPNKQNVKNLFKLLELLRSFATQPVTSFEKVVEIEEEKVENGDGEEEVLNGDGEEVEKVEEAVESSENKEVFEEEEKQQEVDVEVAVLVEKINEDSTKSDAHVEDSSIVENESGGFFHEDNSLVEFKPPVRPRATSHLSGGPLRLHPGWAIFCGSLCDNPSWSEDSVFL